MVNVYSLAEAPSNLKPIWAAASTKVISSGEGPKFLEYPLVYLDRKYCQIYLFKQGIREHLLGGKNSTKWDLSVFSGQYGVSYQCQKVSNSLLIILIENCHL